MPLQEEQLKFLLCNGSVFKEGVTQKKIMLGVILAMQKKKKVLWDMGFILAWDRIELWEEGDSYPKIELPLNHFCWEPFNLYWIFSVFRLSLTPFVCSESKEAISTTEDGPGHRRGGT